MGPGFRPMHAEFLDTMNAKRRSDARELATLIVPYLLIRNQIAARPGRAGRLETAKDKLSCLPFQVCQARESWAGDDELEMAHHRSGIHHSVRPVIDGDE